GENSLWSLAIGLWCDLFLRVSSAFGGDFAACARFNFICDCLLKECFTFKPQSTPPASERLFGGENSLWSLAIGLWCDALLRKVSPTVSVGGLCGMNVN
ncbi:MAG: hypothetical protein IM558_00595, partial [Chitinophagaceae bacterium]|nr:hypothetical protein [Chitinophagaceae bacterium]